MSTARSRWCISDEFRMIREVLAKRLELYTQMGNQRVLPVVCRRWKY